MVMDTKDGPLTTFDWDVLAMKPFQGVRMNIPMPSKKEDLRTVAYALAKMSEEFHKYASSPLGTNRSEIGNARNYTAYQHNSFRKLSGEWKEDYEKLKEAEQKVVDIKEHSRHVTRTR